MTTDQPTRPRQLAARVVGLDGPEVVVSGRLAAWLGRYANLARLRMEHRGVDPDIDDGLLALAVAGTAWRERRGGGAASGTGEDGEPEPDPQSTLTTTQAATLLGVSERAVRRACAEGRLDATRHGDRWAIDREAVAFYRGRAA